MTMSRIPVRPYLIDKQEDGTYRLTVRETRYNGQGYPLVTAIPQDGSFRTANEARKFAREQFGAEPGQFATK